MRIGILSDTHNNIELTRRAVSLFREAGVDLVVHCGDFTSPRMLALFEGLDCRFVLGNGDIDVEHFAAEAKRLGFGPVEEQCAFEAGGKRILVFHGHDVPRFRRAVASGDYDYVIKGHTHSFENYLSGGTRVINPGSLYGADEFTVAVLDTETGKVERIVIEAE